MTDTLQALDHIRLNFSPSNLHALNIAIGIVMFGVALEIKLRSFKEVFLSPKPAIIGFASQFILLPTITFLLIILLKDWLTPTMALGMVLVAACPGGNISNFITSLAKGNVVLSVSLTAIGTLAAVVLTPLNFAFWGKLVIQFFENQSAGNLIHPIEIDIAQVFQTIFIILGIPLISGIIINTKFPEFTKKISGIVKKISLVIFVVIIIITLSKNFNFFLHAIQYIFIIVLIHNAVALLTGYGISSVFKLNPFDRKSISIETGIQNSGLALVLIFNPKIFPPELELGGMAIIAAWWGIWHMISGLAIAGYWGSSFNFFGLKKASLSNSSHGDK
jgi:BASS family bile acid:Na+ symporter